MRAAETSFRPRRLLWRALEGPQAGRGGVVGGGGVGRGLGSLVLFAGVRLGRSGEGVNSVLLFCRYLRLCFFGVCL